MLTNKFSSIQFLFILVFSLKVISAPCECCSLWNDVQFLKSGTIGIDSIAKHFENVHSIPVDSLSVYGASLAERSEDTVTKYLDTALVTLHKISHYDLCGCNSMEKDSFFYIMEILPDGEVVQYNCEDKKFTVSLGDIRKISSRKNIYPKIKYDISCLVYLDVIMKDNAIQRTKIKKIDLVNTTRKSTNYGHCLLPMVWKITRDVYTKVTIKKEYTYLITIGINDKGIIDILKDDYREKRDTIPYKYIRSQLLDYRFNELYRPLEIVQIYVPFRIKKPVIVK